MKRIYAILPVLCAVIFHIPQNAQAQAIEADFFRQEGIASWYGPEFDGRPTASGEIFNSALLTAAHPTLPFGTMVVVTNRHNNRRVTVRINDRGPFVSARIIDVSRAAAEQLDMLITGTAPVLVESVDRVSFAPAPGHGTGDIFWSPAPQPLPPQAPVFAPPPPQAAVPLPAPHVPVQPALPPVAQIPVQPPAHVEPVQTPFPVHGLSQPHVPPAHVLPPAHVPQAQPQAHIPQAFAPPAAQNRARLIPAISPVPGRTYRLQVGSFRVARNAVNTFERLRNSGLSPAYERSGDYFRVVLAGIPGAEVDLVAQKIWAAGFTEALIRQE